MQRLFCKVSEVMEGFVAFIKALYEKLKYVIGMEAMKTCNSIHSPILASASRSPLLLRFYY